MPTKPRRREPRLTPTPLARLQRIRDIIDAVEGRCSAVDGDVTPTLREMTRDELRRIYKLAGGKVRR